MPGPQFDFPRVAVVGLADYVTQDLNTEGIVELRRPCQYPCLLS